MISKASESSSAPPLSEEDYARCFERYKRISAEWDVLMRWIENRLLLELPRKTAFSVLSVGSGSGDFDMRLMRILKSQFGRVNYLAVEPNEVHCEKFRERIAAQQVKGLHTEIRCVPFEETNFETQFDLIHFTHSLYYLKYRQQAILKAIEKANSNGRILIFHQTPKGIYQIQSTFMYRVKGNTYEMFSSENLRELLEECGVPYEFEILDSYLDVTDLDFSSEAGQDLISFFLECDVSRVVSTLREDIANYVRSISSFERGGHSVISHPIGVFSIRKGRRD